MQLISAGYIGIYTNNICCVGVELCLSKASVWVGAAELEKRNRFVVSGPSFLLPGTYVQPHSSYFTWVLNGDAEAVGV